MKTYHGTSKTYSRSILQNGIDFTKGGGELGQGFYVGDLLHRACAWAWNKYGNDSSVIVFDLNDSEFLKLNLEILDSIQATELRGRIRKQNGTRKYVRGVDAIWAPIVGQKIPYFNQIKFESSAKQFLTNTKISKW